LPIIVNTILFKLSYHLMFPAHYRVAHQVIYHMWQFMEKRRWDNSDDNRRDEITIDQVLQLLEPTVNE
jgi:hypothetical protein